MAPLQVSKNLLGLFLRRSCPGCGSDLQGSEVLCPWCRLRVQPCTSAHWSGNGEPAGRQESESGSSDRTLGVRVFSAVVFDGLPGELLRRLKFNGEKYLASAVADLIVEHSAGIPEAGDIIVPVPAGPARLKERGYNQVRLIARKLASRTGARVSGMLVRDDSPSQVGLSTSQRRLNVQGVFHPGRRCRIRGIAGIWLLDDVATTFSTVHSAAMTLLDNGAERVTGLTMAYRRRTAGSIIRSEFSRR